MTGDLTPIKEEAKRRRSKQPTFDSESRLRLRPQAAAAALRISRTTLGQWVDELREKHGIEIEVQESGAASIRRFKPEDLFAMAQMRRDRSTKPFPRPVTMAIYAQKGGVGKTSVAGNVATSLQLLGYRVLVIDADHQANLTSSFGYDPELTQEEAAEIGMEDRCVEGHFGYLFQLPPFYCAENRTFKPLAELIKKPNGDGGVHLVPSDGTLTTVEQAFALAMNREMIVRDFIEAATQKSETPNQPHDLQGYDYIIFDCAPQAAHNPLIRPILLASDILISPVRMDAFSIKGLSQMFEELRKIIKTYRRSPSVMLVPTFFDERLRRVRDSWGTLIDQYSGSLAKTKIINSEEMPSNIDYGIPLSLLAPTSKIVQECFNPLVDEIVANSIKILKREERNQ